MKTYKILIVDDDLEFLKVMRAYLKNEERLDLITESNPVEALKHIEAEKPDILFVDYFMPQMTGEELVKKLREINKSIFIILQTGYSGDKPATKMLDEIDIQGYYDKAEPFNKFQALVKSTIKTLDLIETIKEKDKQIELMDYNDKLMGRLVEEISDGLKNQVLTVETGMKLLDDIKDNKIQEYIECVKNATENQRTLLAAINFRTMKTNDLNSIIDNIRNLTKVKLKEAYIKLNVTKVNNIYIKADSFYLTLILLEIVTRLAEKNNNIDIEISEDNDTVILLINNECKDIYSILEETKFAIQCDYLEIKLLENGKLKLLLKKLI